MVDHAIVGAKYAIDEFGPVAGWILAYAIAGHHHGIPNGIEDIDGFRSLTARLADGNGIPQTCREYALGLYESAASTQEAERQLEQEFMGFMTSIDKLPKNQRRSAQAFALFMMTRFLHSCLVDADYLDTEAYTEEQKAAVRRGNCQDSALLKQLLGRYDAYMDGLKASATATPVNRMRSVVEEDCLLASSMERGIFTLSVPTGGGKTLASLGFALRHAVEHGMSRIIFAIPFTSIVEQTAKTLREIFGDENVLEHHSNYDFEAGDEERSLRERLAVQNWDAPIIVTTNNQLLESLFSNKPGKSRKVHNMANSVIVFDEAQTLPDGLLQVSLAAIEGLTALFHCTVVLCTATQPALDAVWPFSTEPYEIACHRDGFAEVFGSRTRFVNLGLIGIEDLAEELSSQHQVLCIVGKKKEAIDIYEQVKTCEEEHARLDGICKPAEAGIFHLSTYMTPSHRARVLEEVRCRLHTGQRCIVVSTQLIEAGVDVDFPVVYRELAGVDSLFQAAGRCNRSGSSEDSAPVYVFECSNLVGERYTTTRWLESMKEITRLVAAGYRQDDDPFGEKLVERFFHERYGSGADLDANGVFRSLAKPMRKQSDIQTMSFSTCARDFKLIDDDGETVFVRCGAEAERLYARLKSADTPEAIRSLIRKAQMYSINLDERELSRIEGAGFIEQLGPLKILDQGEGCLVVYSEETGYRPEGMEEPAFLMA